MAPVHCHGRLESSGRHPVARSGSPSGGDVLSPPPPLPGQGASSLPSQAGGLSCSDGPSTRAHLGPCPGLPESAEACSQPASPPEWGPHVLGPHVRTPSPGVRFLGLFWPTEMLVLFFSFLPSCLLFPSFFPSFLLPFHSSLPPFLPSFLSFYGFPPKEELLKSIPTFPQSASVSLV